MEGCNHWLLQCLRWDLLKDNICMLTNVGKRIPYFAAFVVDNIQSTAITGLACKDPGIAQLHDLFNMDCEI